MPQYATLPETVKKQGQTAVAITDHGALYGAVDFYKACVAEGIKPIIGCETYVAPEGAHIKTTSPTNAPHHLVLLAKNETGCQIPHENSIRSIHTRLLQPSADRFRNGSRVTVKDSSHCPHVFPE